MKKLITIILLFIISSKLSANISYEIDTVTYAQCIEHIKHNESFKSNVYISLNNKYIGYGHLIKKNEHYVKISEYQATEILKKDLNGCLKVMFDNTKLKSNKLLALGLLSYNLGVGKVLNYIKTQNILNDYKKTLNYCKYKVDGNVKHSEKLKQRRLFEYNLWVK